MALNPKRVQGPSARPLLKKDILIAQSMTSTASAAAQYLRVSYMTYKKYANMYGCFTRSTNNKGFFRKKHHGKFGLDSILAGEHPGYDRRKLKARLIAAGYLANRCGLCGFDKKRPVDDKVPLLLDYIDGDSLNLSRENLHLLCYNCSYLTTGKIREPTAKPKKEPAYMSQGYQDVDLTERGLTIEEIAEIQRELMK